jgi:hypothetical protein
VEDKTANEAAFMEILRQQEVYHTHLHTYTHTHTLTTNTLILTPTDLYYHTYTNTNTLILTHTYTSNSHIPTGRVRRRVEADDRLGTHIYLLCVNVIYSVYVM